MNFDKDSSGYSRIWRVRPLKPEKAPPLYIAYDPERAEVSDIPHRNLRDLYNRGDASVVNAMLKYRELTDRGRTALMAGDWESLSSVMNENFDLRRNDHANRPREFANGRSSSEHRRQRQVRRQRRRNRRTLQRRQTIPTTDRRPRSDPLHGASPADF